MIATGNLAESHGRAHVFLHFASALFESEANILKKSEKVTMSP